MSLEDPKPLGMQGSWTKPRAKSPVRAAVLAAIPEDGSPIGTAEVIIAVKKTLPEVASGTIGGYLAEVALSARHPVERLSWGVYRRKP